MKHKKKRKNEAGLAGIVVLFAIFGILVLCIGYATKRQSSLQSQGQLSSGQANKWRGKSYLAQVDRAIQVKMPQYFVSDAAMAKNCRSTPSGLKVFDPVEMSSSSSNPAATIVNGTVVCSLDTGAEKTSLLGNAGGWAQTHYQQIMAAANVLGEPSLPVTVVSFNEAVRRLSPNVEEPVYQFRYLLQATIEVDNYTKQNDVVLALDGVTCGTSAVLRAASESVERGQPVTFTIEYTLAKNLKVLNSADNVIFDQDVNEEIEQRFLNFQFIPSATDTYRVISNGSSGCSAVSATVRVIVTDTPVVCPTLVLGASSYLVNSGESVDIVWETTNAAEVTLEGEIVDANGTKTFTIPAERTFTLIARDAANICPATRQVTVRVNLASCFTPVVNQFVVSPPSATPGQSVTINWQIDNVMPGGTVNITLPDGAILSNVGATGTRTINAPGNAGTYNYFISVTNPCGTATSASAPLVVSNSCIPVTFTTPLSANPSSVFAGGNQTVRFSWALSDVADSINLSGVGDVSGNYADIPQPQSTTTYTLTAIRCGQAVRSQTVVNVGTTNTPPVQRTSREITINSGFFGCETSNQIRASAGLPLIPCVKWMVEDTFNLRRESGNSYLLTFTSVSNADTHPWFRSKRRPSVQIGVFGIVVTAECIESILQPMCYENREQYSYFSDFGGFTNTPDITPVIYPNVPTADNTYQFRLQIPPQALKVVIRDVGAGGNFYTIYYPGYNFGAGDNFPEDEYNYGYPSGTGSQQSVFDVH